MRTGWEVRPGIMAAPAPTAPAREHLGLARDEEEEEGDVGEEAEDGLVGTFRRLWSMSGSLSEGLAKASLGTSVAAPREPPWSAGVRGVRAGT